MDRLTLLLLGLSLVACAGTRTEGASSHDAGTRGTEDAERPSGDDAAPDDGGDAAWVEATVDHVLVDESRGREVTVRVHYPAGSEASAPVVLVSHGGDGSVRGHLSQPTLATELVAHGYVTVHLNHLASGSEAAHRLDRPQDVSFVLDRLEAGLVLPSDAPSLDLERVAHVGHSWGAYTAHAVAGAVFDQGSFRDARVDAIVPLSPQGWDQFGSFDRGPEDNSWRTVLVPSLCVIGELEMSGPVRLGSPDDWRLRPFERYPTPPARFAMVLADQDHEDLGGNGPPEVALTIASNVRAFLDFALRGDASLECRVGELEPIPGTVVLRRGSSCAED